MDTPKLVLDYGRVKGNIEGMAAMANRAGVILRPHIKSHKCPELARMQLEAGAAGITVAKLGEAEIMADYGVTDIFIANQLVGEEKWERLCHLTRKARVSVGVDSLALTEGLARAVKKYGIGYGKSLDVLIEIDSGLHRCGVEPGEPLLQLARGVASIPELRLRGIFTHAGHAYGARNKEELEQIGRSEGEILVKAAEDLRRIGMEIDVVSVGSTPTVNLSAFVSGVTEIRPGNYVFYDAMQLALGVIPSTERCSLRVYSTVISHPGANRWVIDAGSKTLALDQGAHGHAGVRGYGLIVGEPNLQIVRLSEEHGIIEGDSTLQIGDIIEIIPNHACTVVNLFDQLEVRQGNVTEAWPIAARGKNC